MNKSMYNSRAHYCVTPRKKVSSTQVTKPQSAKIKSTPMIAVGEQSFLAQMTIFPFSLCSDYPSLLPL